MKMTLLAAIQICDGCPGNNGLERSGMPLYQIDEVDSYFDRLTRGHYIIFGIGRSKVLPTILPDREYIFISSKKIPLQAHIRVAATFKDGVHMAKTLGAREVYVRGNRGIYLRAWKKADQLELALIYGEKEADTFFPDWSTFGKTVNAFAGERSDLEGINYSFVSIVKETEKAV